MNITHEAIAAEAFERIRANILHPRAGEIGEPQRHIEFEPFPASVPVQEPAVAPQPEKVPA